MVNNGVFEFDDSMNPENNRKIFKLTREFAPSNDYGLAEDPSQKISKNLVQDDLASINPGQWMSDKAMERYLYSLELKARNRGICIVDPSFVEVLRESPDMIESIKTQAEQANTLLFPINSAPINRTNEGTGHWMLVEVRLNQPQKSIEFNVYDSLRHQPVGREIYVRAAEGAVKQISTAIAPLFEGWSFKKNDREKDYREKETVQQNDGSDCAPIILSHMTQIVTGKELLSVAQVRLKAASLMIDEVRREQQTVQPINPVSSVVQTSESAAEIRDRIERQKIAQSFLLEHQPTLLEAQEFLKGIVGLAPDKKKFQKYLESNSSTEIVKALKLPQKVKEHLQNLSKQKLSHETVAAAEEFVTQLKQNPINHTKLEEELFACLDVYTQTEAVIKKVEDVDVYTQMQSAREKAEIALEEIGKAREDYLHHVESLPLNNFSIVDCLQQENHHVLTHFEEMENRAILVISQCSANHVPNPSDIDALKEERKKLSEYVKQCKDRRSIAARSISTEDYFTSSRLHRKSVDPSCTVKPIDAELQPLSSKNLMYVQVVDSTGKPQDDKFIAVDLTILKKQKELMSKGGDQLFRLGYNRKTKLPSLDTYSQRGSESNESTFGKMFKKGFGL